MTPFAFVKFMFGAVLLAVIVLATFCVLLCHHFSALIDMTVASLQCNIHNQITYRASSPLSL
jgi:hypothetical protein